jgi:hypothetical protein
MGRQELEQTARELIAEGKGILAADETVSTITQRFICCQNALAFGYQLSCRLFQLLSCHNGYLPQFLNSLFPISGRSIRNN